MERQDVPLWESNEGTLVLKVLRQNPEGPDADLLALRVLEVGTARECLALAEINLHWIEGEWIANRLIEVGSISEILEYAREYPGPWRKRLLRTIGEKARKEGADYWWETRHAVF